MSRKRLVLVAASSALGLFALTCGPQAIAQSMTPEHEVKVEASKVVTLKEGRSQTEMPNETVRLSRQVSIADLDLASESGRAELHQRISSTAATVCKQLEELYPPGAMRHEKMDQAACIESAVNQAMEAAQPNMESTHNSENGAEEQSEHESQQGSESESESEHEPQ